MRHLFARIPTLLVLVVSSTFLMSQAQTTPRALTTAGPSYYDLSQEVVLVGTISSVLAQPPAGMLAGSHLVLTTLSGPVDISLGMFGLQGKGALSVANGQQVQVTGVMKTYKGQQVLLARTVKAEDYVYAIRNEHGIPITPQARERANHMALHQETR